MTSPARKLFRIGCVATCLAFTQHARAEGDWDAARHVRTDWVFASMKESDVRPTLDRALKDQVRWADLPGNAPDAGAFRCTKLALPPPSAEAQAAFDAAPSPRAWRAVRSTTRIGKVRSLRLRGCSFITCRPATTSSRMSCRRCRATTAKRPARA